MARRRSSVEVGNNSPVICFRLEPDEVERWKEVFDRAKKRNSMANRTVVVRELLRLPGHNLLAGKDIAYFRGVSHGPLLEELMDYFEHMAPDRQEQLIQLAQEFVRSSKKKAG